MTPTRLILGVRKFWRQVRKHSAVAALFLAIVAFSSALIGVGFNLSKSDKELSLRNVWNGITDSIYEAAQVLLLNMASHDGDDFNFFIGLARVASVLLVTLVAVQAIGTLFKNSFDHFRLWFAGKGSVLIGGLGRIGLQLATDYARQGKLVVIQEISDFGYWAQTAEDAGAIVLEHDVTDVNNLRDHVFHEPAIIHLVTGSDLANINALVNVKTLRREYFQKKQKHLSPCDCYVHIDDPALQRTLLRSIVESSCKEDPNLRIHPFNIYHETACQLIIEQLTPIRPSKDEVGLYVIFGFEQMGVAMLKELAEFAHFENKKRSRILVLVPPSADADKGEAAESAYQRCIAQWSRLSPRFVHRDLADVVFDPDCDDWASQKRRPEIDQDQKPNPMAVEYAANVHFCELRNEHSISVSEAKELARLAGAQGSVLRVKPAFLFCFEEDERNYRLANELNDHWQDFEGINVQIDPCSLNEVERGLITRHQEYRIPLFVFLPRSGPLQDILSNSVDSFALRPFGAVGEGLERAHDELVEDVAIDIAYSYDARHNPNVSSREQYLEAWSKKHFWEHVSNRNAAEHARIMIQILGFSIAGRAKERASSSIDFNAFDEQDKRSMACIEHNRWMAERLLMGWVYGPKCNQPPQRESMIPNNILSPEESRKDYEQVKTVLECLQKRGVLFHRVVPNHHA